MSAPPICPCDEIVHPRIISNPPRRDVVAYRVGDYASFRHALLRPRPDEIALAGWHPAPGTDLALQLLEWWAYLADVLTFYNERAVQELLLGTASLPGDVRRIVRLLGYRPRPGIGATGVVAALTDSTTPFVLPRGFAIEGVAPPGQPAQIFELDDDVEIGRLGRRLPLSARFPSPPGHADTQVFPPATRADGHLVDATTAAPGGTAVTVTDGADFTISLDGVIASIKPDDTLLLLARDWTGAPLGAGQALSVVQAVVHAWNALGQAITTVTMRAGASLPDAVDASKYRLLRATKLAHLWLYHEKFPGSTDPAVVSAGIAAGQVAQVAESFLDPLHLFSGGMASTPPQDPRPLAGLSFTDPLNGVAHLEAITRGIVAGDPVLFEQRLSGQTVLVKVTGYAEDIWYANPPESDRIGQGPPVGPPSSRLLGGGASPIPIPHSKITFAPDPRLDLMALDGFAIKTIVAHYGWQEVAPIVDTPATGPVQTVTPTASPDLPPGAPLPVLVEDANGYGVPGYLGVPGVAIDRPLVPPLRALVNLLPVSRGETVAREILGSGDPILVRQEFALARAPLTYLADTGPRSINGYRSTLEIRVDGIAWNEVASFYDQPPDARVFVTREDDDQKTYVRFGDGEHGARLPAGVDNVVARYRHGSGAAVPRPGTLTSILRPEPGLRAIRNPVPMGGGADPDPPDQLRRYAPRSVLTFGRAVSGDDYETLAAQTPGVSRARAYWAWDAAQQRTLVKVFVGDDAAAVAGARDALRAFADPNRPVVVALAAPLYPDLTLTLEVDPAFDPAAVETAVGAALLDPARPPFGAGVVRIGEVVYDSEIYDACLRVPGVVAVHDLAFALWQRQQIVAGAPGRVQPWSPRDLVDPQGTDDPFEPWVTVGGGVVHRIRHARRRRFHDVLRVEADARHNPGPGNFYLLREDRLHLRREIARHVL